MNHFDEKNKEIDIMGIRKILPHRYPFALLDKIVDWSVEERTIIAQKNVTINEDFFNGHFPDFPVMPGVLIVESMAQATAILGELMAETLFAHVVKKAGGGRRTFMLAGIDKVRVKRPVVPGDILMIESRMVKQKNIICTAKSVAKVDGQVVCSANLMAAYKDY
ncbi:3-hydroxyacyl-[acyl-carrier-protein] dehydratase FabZ [Francisella halioticida]|uniref:3-hydroxyacyl-[acyl-carrier-protein] dehydratase FabZ n=1 Tax=Francisella halioticida TaxID=549298 RepID=A0ABM6M119_9GAMM|nr:3-hydroxyacyl-ACP dehydratase FabZ [Francisella halioticida]ASG68580.1 3-hydroxyacyl-[acyl-carrier-protein] dehydratase FabZ [Francisella halioticida]BCD91485.1 3-hydroxyacyl-[acyl-carrier-protein] dehydratase FabZ [Francisella halioticida]